MLVLGESAGVGEVAAVEEDVGMRVGGGVGAGMGKLGE